MKKAFSLVELLVVIAIIGVLAGVLLGTFSGGTESARTARCLSNMRNLAAGCQGYAMTTGRYPCAGSMEYCVVGSDSAGNTTTIYREIPGWISWNSQGTYSYQLQTQSAAKNGWYISTYEESEDARLYCLTNGAIWQYVSGNHEIYKCPTHVNKMSKMPNWSYAMNAYFGWTGTPGTDVQPEADACGLWYNGFSRADRVLLFAELPVVECKKPQVEQQIADVGSENTRCDCILQYRLPDKDNAPRGMNTKTGSETIGFNHKVGKMVYANVVFADGHVEKLTCPKKGLSQSALVDLTSWLCTGYDVSFDGSDYKRMTND